MIDKDRLRRWAPWAIGVLALAVAIYSVLGVGMIASLAPDPATRGWATAAYIYLALFLLSIVVLLGSVVTIYRGRVRERSGHGSPAA